MRNGQSKNLIAICCVLILIIPSISLAGNIDIVLGGGADLTAGYLQKRSDFGYAGLLSFVYKQNQNDPKAIALVGNFSYHNFPTDSSYDLKIISGELNLRLDRIFSTDPNMYLIGGGGLAKVEYGSKETSPMVSVGVGVEKGHIVMETKIVRIFGDQIKETTFIPFTIGVRF